MKRIFLLAIALVLSLNIYSNPVNESTARQVALNWYNFKAEGIKVSSEITKTDVITHEGIATLYTFTFKDGGFVIVSADDATSPILGYSVENPLCKEDGSMSPALKDWLLGYSQQIASIKRQKLSNQQTIDEWNNIINKIFVKGGKTVNPLVTTTWDQMSPFNYYCPSSTIPVGCVATATAQVMNYHHHPASGVASHSYTHTSLGLQSANFGETTYNWTSLPTATDNANHDVAKLMRHVGVAVDMDYAASGSGAITGDLTYVLPNYFKYDHGISHKAKADFTDATWIELLKSELDASRPMVYAGSSTASGGHAFVCDGYNASDQFHFNWGWTGAGDGYFSITSLTPPGNNFSENQRAIIGIKPATTPEFKMVRKHSDLDAAVTAQSPYLNQISAASDLVAWGIGADGTSANANYKIYGKTVDGGLTWTSKAVNNLGGTAFSCISAVNDQIAYIAIYGSSQSDQKVIKTIDGGANWTVTKNGGAHTGSFFNVVHFFNQNDGFIQGDPDTEFELYTTSNGGTAWTRVPGANIPDPVSGEYGIVHHYTAVGNTIWFTTNKGRILKSNDKGLNWTVSSIKSGVTGSALTYSKIAFSDNLQTGLAHVTYSPTGQSPFTYEYYKTTDGGATWTQIATPTGNFYDGDISAVPGLNGKFYSVGAKAAAPAKMGVSVSTDGGNTWVELAEYYKNFQFTSIAMASDQKGYVGSFAGKYSDGAWMIGVTESHTITASAGANGTISPNGAVAVGHGTNKSFVIKANLGYVIDALTVDGSTISEAADQGTYTYTFENVTAIHTIAATFKAKNYIITASAGANGTITPSGEVTVGHGTNKAFVSKADNTFVIDALMVDGAAVTAAAGKTTYTHTFNNIVAAHTIAATFKKGTGIDPNYVADIKLYPNPVSASFIIESTGAIEAVEVFDIYGRLIHSAQGTASQKLSIGTDGWSCGVYTVYLKTKSGISTHRIVKQ